MNRPALLPLLKWSGGKRSEIPVLKPAYPATFSRVVEPFAGGAAVSWDLNADHTVLNDVSDGLVDFYRTVQSPLLRPLFVQAVQGIDAVRKDIAKHAQGLSDAQVNQLFAAAATSTLLNASMEKWVGQFPHALHAALKKDLRSNLVSKLSTRIPNLEKKHAITFSSVQRKEHLETALQAGVYTSLRRVYNGEIALPSHWATAAWYVVRSTCYSGMFRYGKNGAFNVPYGGIAYNGRDFAPSLAHLASADVVDFLARTDINRLDFEQLFSRYNNFNSDDFIFVDPPYDSAFSQYNAEGDFTAQDQKRLASVLLNTPAKWMLVIKNTPFILGLYQHPSLFKGVFGKTYQVNFRNRHDRGVEHLVVTNYPLPPNGGITPL